MCSLDNVSTRRSCHLTIVVGTSQELQAKNAQLLAVTRQLGSDAEREKAALRAELEGEAASRMERLAHQIAQQRSEREQQEVAVHLLPLPDVQEQWLSWCHKCANTQTCRCCLLGIVT